MRTYHDPLHGAITLDRADAVENLLIQLIDTPAFQRLRRIRQLGPASLTFHGAESSRFTHSLGVMAIARQAFDRLAQRYAELRPYRATVLCAALLHDLGHGPFSHTAEEIFGNPHEVWTCRILRDYQPIADLLHQFAPDLSWQIEQVYSHQHPVPFVWQLISSQLDCDRLDYLLRDSYFTGASYGQLDLERILLAIDYDPLSQQLVVARKGLAAIEHYLVVRYFMYAQVYNHAKNLAATWLLEQAFGRARELLAQGSLTADETVQAWLQQKAKGLSLAHYLAGDDIVFMYHLQRWQLSSDRLLADLCRRFLDRDLPKAIEVTDLAPSQQHQLLQQLAANLSRQSLDPKRYSGFRKVWNRGYTLYQRGIKLKSETGLQEISQLSPLVKTLVKPVQRVWLIYPAEAEPQLLQLKASLEQHLSFSETV
ncbi:HD domain-containing protein [Almyronema epifaneia]|uniref:HD domain-containing protein n=1 Tax=Almyronema epifaneia S1 TaxID=2991925 RepID=A0ABW6IH97_9CYAN